MGLAYRIRQFRQRVVVTFRPLSLDETPARRLLAPAEHALYEAMPIGDRAHALCVLRRMAAETTVPDDVAAAALLHDVGKAGGGLTLLHRTVVIALKAVWPALLQRLATQDGPRWRRPFATQARHAALGAERCARAGCAPLTVALVGAHEHPPSQVEDPFVRDWLVALQRADDAC